MKGMKWIKALAVGASLLLALNFSQAFAHTKAECRTYCEAKVKSQYVGKCESGCRTHNKGELPKSWLKDKKN